MPGKSLYGQSDAGRGIDAVSEIQQPIPAVVQEATPLQHLDEVHEAGMARAASRPRFICAFARHIGSPLGLVPAHVREAGDAALALRFLEDLVIQEVLVRGQVDGLLQIVMDRVTEVAGARIFLARRR